METVERGDQAEPKSYTIHDAAEMTPEDLAAAMRLGQFEVLVDGALSEWGSRLEMLMNKLERSVVHWHEAGISKSVLIRFVEPEARAEQAEAAKADEGGEAPNAGAS